MAKKKKKAKKKTTYGKAKGSGTMGFQVLGDERAKIKARAKRLANGNVSAWIRHAALNYNKPLRD